MDGPFYIRPAGADVSEETLKRLARRALMLVVGEVRQLQWRRGKPDRLIRSFSTKVSKGRIILTSSHPAVFLLEKGARPHWQRVRNIPILTSWGEVVYRRPRWEITKAGKWRHPGFKGKGFMGRALRAVNREVMKGLQEEARLRAMRMIHGGLGR